ncbi:MAG: hypothetical protein ACKV2T_24265, partial [Kofleriaceae bacterium]
MGVVERGVAQRYVAWLQRRRAVVLSGAGLAFVMAVYLIVVRLPLRADVSYLLPEKARSVRDLRTIEQRVSLYDQLVVLIQSSDADRRASASTAIATGLRRMDPDLVREVRDDDAAARAYIRANVHQYIPLAQLVDGCDALRQLQAELAARANPLFISLDDEQDVAADSSRLADDIDELRNRWRELRERLTQSSYVSGDVQRVMVRIAFDRTDTKRAARLMREVD